VITLSYDSLPASRCESLRATLRRARIVVFYDRIAKGSAREGAGPRLAQVLVHEITHILEGVKRHSGSGVMKARWAEWDLFDMVQIRRGRGRRIPIYVGLDAWKSRADCAVLIATQWNPRLK
jgi:hypothetical protein